MAAKRTPNLTTPNAIIGHLMDRPSVFIICTKTRRGPLWATSMLSVIPEKPCRTLIERGILVERDPSLPSIGGDAPSYELSSEFRAREEARLRG